MLKICFNFSARKKTKISPFFLNLSPVKKYMSYRVSLLLWCYSAKSEREQKALKSRARLESIKSRETRESSVWIYL